VSLSLRPLAETDAQAVADLLAAYRAFHNGVLDRVSTEDILDWWKHVDDIVGVVDDDGRLVGAGTLRRRGSFNIADGVVHPDERGRGAGTLLLEWNERRTAEAGLVSVRPGTTARDTSGKALLESRGYRYIRSFYRMTIELDAPPPEPVWPAGFTCALEPEQEHVLYGTLEEAFEDHWGFEPRTFEEWMAQNGPLEGRLCYLVRAADGTPAAAEICDEERFGAAWVSVLGVRPAFRRHGLGEALLRQAFHDLYERGRTTIALGVDAENTTGATRLYERVGMQVALQDDAYEKVLGPD
jgi:ribosomal protein S18 acetylase RimI-like enzyme